MLAFAALFALQALPALAAVRDVPFLSGRVIDEAALLSPEARTALEGKLAALEKDTKAQVAVLTVASLDGEPIEDFSHRVAETWKLGDVKRDDGVLFLVARDDRKMRIEVGYGLEPTLTDIRTKRIQDDLVRPAFRSGDYAGGIEKGIDAIGAQLRGQAPPDPPPAASPEVNLTGKLIVGGMLLVILLVFGGLGVMTPGCACWAIYAIVTPFVGIMGAVATSDSVGVAVLFGWLIGFPLLRLWLRLTGRVKKAPAGTLRGSKGSRGWSWGTGWTSGGGGSSSWSSSSSSSSSSFSGGGGSFGGGGSSSSW
ncbi:MAG TPA: TPM domain-containing protein [Thermoanaerobaculia bacterium]|nr:TPM domain-containing protein [Thermoanaerobaculia bacterium]